MVCVYLRRVTLKWLRAPALDQRGLICVTHDINHLYRFDRVIVMNDGVIVGDGPWIELVNRTAIKRILSDLQTEQ